MCFAAGWDSTRWSTLTPNTFIAQLAATINKYEQRNVRSTCVSVQCCACVLCVAIVYACVQTSLFYLSKTVGLLDFIVPTEMTNT